MKLTKSEKKAQKVERVIKIVWGSLVTHMGSGGTYGKPIKNVGSHTFHKNTIRDYAEAIKLLSELY